MAKKNQSNHPKETPGTPEVLSPPSEVSEPMIAAIIKRLEAGKSVRRKLPSGGYLHLDHQVPFLLVYRRPTQVTSPATEQLLRGEASYLIIDGRRRLNKSTVTLVSAIGESLAKSFGAFLIVEIWSDQAEVFAGIMPDFRPAFRILTQRSDALSSSALTLKRALSRIRAQQTQAQVTVTESARPWAPGLPRLVPAPLARRIGCHYLGIGIRPVYEDVETGETFPLIQRALHRGLGRAIRRAVFKFTRDQTTQRPPHYHALGPHSLVKLVWKVDRELAEITADFDFLLSVTPINADQAWSTFKRKRFESEPRFIYRPLPVDPALVKRQLYRIPIEKIEDPALEALFSAQRMELERKLTMLSDRGSRRFLYGSLQLYGRVDEQLLATARHILEHVPARSRGKSAVRQLDAVEFAARAEAEIKYYRERDPRVWSRVEIRDDVVGMLVSHGNLLLNSRQKVAENRVEALLAHEIGTHVLTYFNGQAQPFHQLYAGLPGYEELQEGLAVLAEYLTGGLTGPRLRMLAARVLAASMITEGAGFTEVFRKLDDGYGFSQKMAFNITLRIFRGGGLLKDMVYLRGLMRLLEYLGGGGAFEPLLLGKFGADHLPIIRELQWRKVLSAPSLKPRYLDNPEVTARLEIVCQGITLQDLVKRI
ncbi:MAG: flavohemoglobin expression-modulating QEGLA motif protein [Gammaproteobacteria bacterium]|nr:MAG: flavohemoglobin expression-modulating QEGLA motif protein [Gammaproteobacteria bacterium]